MVNPMPWTILPPNQKALTIINIDVQAWLLFAEKTLKPNTNNPATITSNVTANNTVANPKNENPQPSTNSSVSSRNGVKQMGSVDLLCVYHVWVVLFVSRNSEAKTKTHAK